MLLASPCSSRYSRNLPPRQQLTAALIKFPKTHFKRSLHSRFTAPPFYCSSACLMSYRFNLRYSVVLPIPRMRAAASLSPDVSRSVFRMARRSSSSSGKISLRSGARSLEE
jgi:hypothetical protein